MALDQAFAQVALTLMEHADHNPLLNMLIPIGDLGDERIKSYLSPRDHETRERGEIIVDSHKVVMRLIASHRLVVTSLLAAESFYRQHAKFLAENLDFAKTQLFVAEYGLMEGIVGHRLHQGVLAVAQRPMDNPLTSLASPVIVLNGLNEADNVGAIVRNGHAFGVGSLIVDDASCSPWVRRAIRVSMGSIFNMRVLHTQNLLENLGWLKEHGFVLYAASNDEQALNLPELVPPTGRFALIIGAEAHGIEQMVKDSSDYIVRIPLDPSIDSLNAAVASGIMLYQLTAGTKHL